jgi:DNA recombination protein RmuC
MAVPAVPGLVLAVLCATTLALGLGLVFLWRLHRLSRQKDERLLAELYAGLGLQRTQVESSLTAGRALVVEKLHGALHQGLGELGRSTHAQLAEMGRRLDQRLGEGARLTGESFAAVMARLAAVDEAQRRLDGLASEMMGLHDLLTDKRARGALGEVQLETLLQNALPPHCYRLQHGLGNGTRVDCLLLLPPPAGPLCIDAKFPLENYQQSCDDRLSDEERARAARRFGTDVRRHIDDIAGRYQVPGETSEGAVMFLPAESVFAEIHARHREVVEHALSRRVYLASPSTLMAILTTARAVLRDVETGRQAEAMRQALGQLGQEMARFETRLRKLCDHSRQANDDAEALRRLGTELSRRFRTIESGESSSANEG